MDLGLLTFIAGILALLWALVDITRSGLKSRRDRKRERVF
jgi:hypothetical protein